MHETEAEEKGPASANYVIEGVDDDERYVPELVFS
jgi:hypothetical protein